MAHLSSNRLLNAPVVRSLRKRRYERRFEHASGIGCCRGVFPSFAEAVRSAPPNAPLGYDTAPAAGLYAERLDRLYPSDYPALFWMRDLLRDHTTVFDFGGHVGIAFYAWRRVAPMPPTLRWMVCDVPAVVERGRALAQAKDAHALSFTTSLHDANAADVFHAGGSVQYVEPTLAEMIGALVVRPPHVIVNKTPVHDGPGFVTLQNIGVTFCPYRITPRGEIPRSMTALGYEVVDTWENADLGCALPFHDDVAPVTYAGFYFRLAAPARR